MNWIWVIISFYAGFFFCIVLLGMCKESSREDDKLKRLIERKNSREH